MLRLKNITKDYKSSSETVSALKGIDLAFRKNEFVSILGPSGCGKTTMLNIIGGLDKYTSGDLIINGKSTKQYKDRDWDIYRNHRIGFIFQSYNLIPHQTILGNVELALTISGISKEERIRRAKEALDRVGLKDKYNKKPNQLSGGQCQRVAIARALVNNPEILLADEPTGALDTATSVQIMELIKEISSERLVIMVTHNPELAEQYSSRIVRLLDGKVIEDTDPFSEEDEIAECEKYAAEEEKRIAAEVNALSPKEAKKKNKKKKENAKMSFFTAFKLSTKNLISKKARTALVGVAGSIGITGIAVVLALSSGIRSYVASMQDDMLSGSPITITQNTYDLSALTGMMPKEDLKDFIKEDGKVYINGIIKRLSEMAGTMDSLMVKNDINQNYVDYLNAMPKEYVSEVLLDYGIDISYNMYTDFAEKKGGETQGVSVSTITQIYTSILEHTDFAQFSSYITMLAQSFQQAPKNTDYILSQYDVLAGKVATGANEVMIVVDTDTMLTDVLLAQLGYYSQDEFLNIVYDAVDSDHYDEALFRDHFTYDELLGKTFTWYPNNTILTKVEDEMQKQLTPFTYNSSSDGFSSEGAIDVKVVGILQAKEDISFGCLTSGVYYTSALSDKAIAENKDSEIINYMKENNLESISSTLYQGMSTGITYKYSYTYMDERYEDVTGYLGQGTSMTLIGMAMGGGSSGMGGLGSGSTGSLQNNKIYTITLADLGGNELPTSISIYPLNFDAKDQVNDYLDKWNSEDDVTVNGKTLTKDDRTDIVYNDTLELVIDMINNMINIVSTALISFTSISLVVSTVMIGIITYVSVVERVKEIGVIRSLGGRKKDVSHLFNAETFIIGLLAGLIGIVATYGISAIANVVIYNLTGIDSIAALPVDQAIMLVLLSVALTLISGLVPARSAAKKDPVVALRTE